MKKIFIIIFMLLILISFVSALSKNVYTNVNNTNHNITGVNYLTSNYFVGNGHLITNISADDSNYSTYANSSTYWDDETSQSDLNVNSSTWWASVSNWVSNWFIKVGDNLDFNATKLNNTIIAIDTATNSSMKIYVDARDVIYNDSMKTYVDIQDLSFNSTMTNYVNSQDIIYNDSMKSYVDSWNIIYNDSMKVYVDAQDVIYNDSMKVYADTTFVDVVGDTMSGDLNFSNAAINNPNYVQFNITYVDGTAEGRLQWNIDDGTLEVGMPGGNVVGQILQEQLIRVYNEESFTITNGQVVCASSATGNVKKVKLVSASNHSCAMKTVGIATEDISSGHFGYITSIGLVRGIDTSNLVAAELVYLDVSAGNLTSTPPSSPDTTVVVGICVRSHSNEGILYVHIGAVSYLDELSNIDTTGKANNSILFWNSISETWEDTKNPFFDSVSTDGITLQPLLEKNVNIAGPAFGVYMTGPSGENLPHLIVQSGGGTQASVMLRSFMIANEIAGFHNTSEATDCGSYMNEIGETLKIDCNTTTTGADLLVSDDMQVVGDSWFKNSLGEWRFMTHTLTNIDELHNNLLLSRSDVSLSGTTFTITDSESEYINVVVNRSETIKNIITEDVTVTLGTNSSPIQNFITYQNPSNPTLTASLTPPVVDYANVARMMLGAEGNIYASLGGRSSVDEFIRNSYVRWFNQGVLYVSGFEPTVDSNNVSIGAGASTILLDTHSHSDSVNLINNGSFIVLANGDYLQFNSIDDITEYADGGSIGNNKYYNLVCGLVHNDVNGHRMMCVVQNEPSSEYRSVISAEVDQYDSLNVFPSDSFLNNLYMPVARMVVQRSGGSAEFNVLSNGGMYFDVRGSTSAAGAPASSGITNHNELNNLDYATSGHTGFMSDSGDTATGTYEFDSGTLYIDSVNNKVGIGTTIPSYVLDIGGSGELLRIGNAGSFQPLLGRQSTGGLSISNSGVLADTSDSLQIINDGVINFVVEGNGDVGIGTSSPTKDLHIHSTGDTTLKIGSTGNQNPQIIFGTSASVSTDTVGAIIQANRTNAVLAGDTDLLFKTGESATISEKMIIKSTGKVGIGTSSPAETLHVYHATDNVNQIIESGDSIVYLSLMDNDTTNQNQVLFGAEGNKMVLRGSGTNTVWLNDGKAGIGTDNPSNTLHIEDTSMQLRLGTGASTYWDLGRDGGSGDFYITDDSIGTPLMIDQITGNVGIGTINPNYQLEVSVDGDAMVLTDSADSENTRVVIGDSSGSGGYIDLYNDAEENTAKIRSYAVGGVQAYFAAGNVGIGTVGPIAKLHVDSGTTNTVAIFESDDSIALINLKDNDTSGSGYAMTRTGDNLQFYTNDFTRMTMDEDGEIGIGTTTPAELLHLYSTSGTPRLEIESGLSNLGATLKLTNPEHSYSIYTDNDDLAFYDNDASTSRMTIATNGYVGIGTTNPQANLEVDGNIRTSSGSGGVLTVFDDDAGRRNSLIAGADSEGGYIRTNWGSGGTDYLSFRDAFNVKTMVIDADGKVGIGTDSPNYELTIGDGTGASIEAQIYTATTGTGALLFADGVTTNSGAIFYDHSNNDMSFRTAGNNDQLVIDSSGDVGIGTTTPYETLDVNGNIAISDEITFRPLVDADTTGYINYHGYQGGNTQFRNLWIGDGKTNNIMFVDGSTGNLGIGTISPSSELHVFSDSDSSDTRLTIEQDGTDDAGIHLLAGARRWIMHVDNSDSDKLKIYENAFGSNSMTFDIDGDIGIGTDSPSSYYSASKLAILGTSETALSIISDDDGTGYLLFADGTTTTETYKGQVRYVHTDDRMEFITNAGTADMVINIDGEVGIGTTNPTRTLSVIGTAGVQGILTILNDDNDNSMSIARTDAYGQIQTYNGEPLVINNLGNNVGIGTDSPPYALTVKEQSASTAGYISIDTTTTGHDVGIVFEEATVNKWIIRNDASANTLDFYDYSTGADEMVIEQGGDIGFGDITPPKDVTLKFSSANTAPTTGNGLAGGGEGNGLLIYNVDTTVGSYANLDFRANNMDARIFADYQSANTGRMGFVVESGNEQLSLTSTNKVGINNPAPTQTLDVNGVMMVGSDSQVDNHNSYFKYSGKHYDKDEEPIIGLMTAATSGKNEIRFGGGSSTGNAANEITFWTTADSTTVTGTETMTLTPTGLGIGDPTPDTKLDVVGSGTFTVNVTADNYNYNDVKTYYNSLSSADFTSKNPDVDNIYINQQYIQASADAITFFAPTHFPNGAIITSAIVYGDATDETWYLYEINHTGGGTLIGTGFLGTAYSLAITVNNSAYSYIYSTTSLDTNDKIYGARDTYTLSEVSS